MKRREFIILTGVGAASTTVLSSCGHPEEQLIPALVPDDEYVPGIDYWKASTCHMCCAGCGIIVRTREHKANKIEGNPLHPVNRGALCARGQAGLQLLYNPDRIRGPLKRVGERGSGQFAGISWDEAIKTLADKLREIRQQPPAAIPSGELGQASAAPPGYPVVFLTDDPSGVTGLVAEWFMSAYGSKQLVAATATNEPRAAVSYSKSEGVAGIPYFDIANATYLLSFGARFLETWHSPVMYSLAYGEFRRSSRGVRGRFVQVEPRMSMTAANADEWLPAAPGTEGLLALAIAQVIVREGLIKSAQAPGFLSEPLDSYAPEKSAEQIDIRAEKIIRIAREFASSDRPLAIAGGLATSLVPAVGDVDSAAAINFLNTLAGNLNKPGGVFTTAARYFDPLEKLRGKGPPSWLPFISQGRVTGARALLVHQANPAYTLPTALEKIRAIPFIASFSSFMDETTELADLVLPDHSYLESWDVKSAYPANRSVVTVTRPVVNPEFNTRQTADVLISLTRELVDVLSTPVPFESAEELVKQASARLQKLGGSITAESSEDFWNMLVERGVWISKEEPKPETGHERKPFALTPADVPAEQVHSGAQGTTESEFSLILLAYEHSALGFGAQANIPWLQELPDPMTSVMWGSWVEINPTTASSLGISDGELVEVQTRHGTVRAPAVVHPAIRPDVVAMPYGQGHTAYGQFATGSGANAAVIDPFAINPWSGAEIVRAKVSKVGEGKLIRFGTSLPERPENRR